MLGILEAYQLRDLRQGFVRLHQFDGFVDPVNVDIVGQGDVHIFFKQCTQIAHGDLKLFGDILLMDLVHIIFVDVIQSVCHIAVLDIRIHKVVIRLLLVQNMKHDIHQGQVDVCRRKQAVRGSVQVNDFLQAVIQNGI